MCESALVPIVLIHGLIGPLDEPAIISELAPHPLLTPSLLGYGTNARSEMAAINLPAQVEYVHRLICEGFGAVPVHVVGHSVGGVIAYLLAHEHPHHVASIISVEGNFTLKDAFWSASVGRMSETEAEVMLENFRADPSGWLARADVAPTPDRLRAASRWLANQPATTLRAMGKSVVEVTGAPSYESILRTVFKRFRIHLIAGARSREGWDVPNWALSAAAGVHIVPDTGHLLMLEDPQAFGKGVRSIVRSHSVAV